MSIIKVDTSGFLSRVGKIASGGLSAAIADGITATAQQVQTEGVNLIKRTFPSATRYTLNGIFVRGATPKSLTASVGFLGRKGGTHHYLDAETIGGTRRLTGYEKKLDNQRAMPGQDLQLDAYGNMPRAQLGKMLLAYVASLSTGEGQGKGPGEKYMVLTKQHGKLRPGIYLRKASGQQKMQYILASAIIKSGKHKGMMKELKARGNATYQRGVSLVLATGVKAPQYQPVFDFQGMARKVVQQNAKANIDAQISAALARVGW